jgi:hypothetical protein
MAEAPLTMLAVALLWSGAQMPKDLNRREIQMYEAFDSFLDLVVWSPDFNADSMADYMRANKNVSPDDHGSLGFAQVIDRYRDKAWAVKDFIKYTNLHKD